MDIDSSEIIMPENARVMTEEEMEYEGGILNFLISAVCVVVDVSAGIAADAGFISRNTATAIQVGATAVGAIASFGITSAVMSGVKVAGEKAVECSVRNAAKWTVKEVTVKPTVAALSIGNTLNSRRSNSGLTWAARVISLW